MRGGISDSAPQHCIKNSGTGEIPYRWYSPRTRAALAPNGCDSRTDGIVRMREEKALFCVFPSIYEK